jgi:hypothetical protein
VDRAQELDLQFDSNPADDMQGGSTEGTAEGETTGVPSLNQDEESDGTDA